MAATGSSLARNLARHGYRVALFNRTYSKTPEVVADGGSERTLSRPKPPKSSLRR
jgi:6-phosphogluconate dehydrogenase